MSHAIKQASLNQLKKELQTEAKNGVDFILAASVVWLVLSWIWTLDYSSYNRSVYSFMMGAFLLPLAAAFSRLLKTRWKLPENPLQPLGLWLNFAQLIYFPLLIFTLLKFPNYFIMAYAIITGAHLFPYAWLYDEMGYAVSAVLISVGALLIALHEELEKPWQIPLFTALILFALAVWITRNHRKKISF